MKKQLIQNIISFAIVIAIIGGTYMYLQAEDSSTSMDYVRIEQNVQQRTDNSTDQTTLVPFGTGENTSVSLLPAEGDFTGYTTFSDDNYKFYQNIQNAVDQIVTVTNRGTVPIYVRTVFAFETPTDKVRILINDHSVDSSTTTGNDDWVWDWTGETTVIDGVEYELVVATSINELGVEETTIPSLLQVALETTADNEDIAPYGNTYEVRAYSQAVQSRALSLDSTAVTLMNEVFGEIDADHHPWMNAETPEDVVEVTAENLSKIDFTQNNVTYRFSGDFETLKIDSPAGKNQIYDGTFANVKGELLINAPGIAHSYKNLSASRAGKITIKGFSAETLNVLAYNNESVNITRNVVNSMSVIGGNFALNIDGNNVNGKFGQYIDGEDRINEYGISLRITDYDLSLRNNIVTDTNSHSIGINGRQGEESSDWGNCGANNKIVEFSGNNITVNAAEKTERAALKIWCDKVYAPYNTSGYEPNDAAKALMDKISRDNVFDIQDTHFVFNIFDYKTNNEK